MSFTSHPEKKQRCFKNGKEYFKLKKKISFLLKKIQRQRINHFM